MKITIDDRKIGRVGAVLTKRVKVVEGDLIAIPLNENVVAVGIILHVSKRIRNGIIVGYYNLIFSSVEAISIDEIGGEFVDTPNYTGKQLVTKGPWQLVGHSDELLASATIPELAVVTTIYYKDEIVHHFTNDEHKAYLTLAVEGGGFVENKLRKHFEITK